ncbi:hypothetical protein FAZ78_13075 [Cereibacter changlensis]|uniref:Uncharacterized protein n=1 Tax=Cereibacter changlensis TaxID=402884 RepID=A0A4U0Z3W3_9RHOB|nr:hypothetical protein [Cereibacter changlensis]TKA96143.1 hypothetical protein FAZ78_13075 [Cereibacter changlensis]
MAFANPINDMLLRTGVDEMKLIDLKSAFGDSYTTFSITNSDGEVVEASIEDGVLSLGLGSHGFSDLTVTATDDAGQSVSDNFRVRVAGENAFTVAVLPDTQNYTSNAALNATFGNMTQWLVDNAESKHISFVVGAGDVTDNNAAYQWDIAEAALRKMDGVLPYSMLPGNHDQGAGGGAGDHSTDYLDDRFSPDKQAATNPDTFGGVYDKEPDRSANTYHTFTAPDGTDWLVLSLEFGPRDDVLRWAGDVIEGHLDHRVIIASHTLTTYAGRSDAFAGQIGAAPVQGYGISNDPQGANDGEAVYRLLTSKYPNVAMTLSGHVLGDSAETNISYSQHGNTVVEMMMDYQNGSTNELVSKGGEGAIRLITIDPDAGAIYTDTYMTERDAYLTGFRDKEELDRDGLTGPYRGHQEVITGLDLKTPDLKAQADAGSDSTVHTEGEAATVTLDAGQTLNASLASSYEWRDADGRVLSTDPVAEVELAGGRHEVTLVVTDAEGRVTTDSKLVIVATPDTLLVDTFNDGDARGWGQVPVLTLAEKLEFAEASDLGLPAMGEVMGFPATAPTLEGFLVSPDMGGEGPIKTYTLAMDLLVTADQKGKWFSLLQTDPVGTSSNDADFLINMSGGIGINGSYSGSFTYDEWHRVVLTVTDLGNGTSTLSKYLDGDLIGTQSMPTARFQIDPEKGFLVFSDNAPNGSNYQTQPGYISSLMFSDSALTAAEVKEMGKASADGIPAAEGALRFDFDGDTPLAPTAGKGSFTVVQPQSVFETTGFAQDSMPGGADGVMTIPAAAPDEGYLITVEGDAPITNYTFITDIYAPEAEGRWQALLQTDPTNGSDADFLVNMSGGLGINGSYPGSFNHDAWQRVALTVSDNGDGTVTLAKYIEGTLVGTQSMPASRYTIDPEKGFLIFSDDGQQVWNFQTNPLSVSSVFFTDRAMTQAEIGAVGGAKAGGIVAEADAGEGNPVQFDFTDGTLAPSYGGGKLELWDREASGSYLDGWTVKGSVNAPNTEVGEGALHDRTDAVDKVLLWRGEGSEDWSGYRFDVTLTSTDNDEIGVVFYYQDADNHYRFTMNSQTQLRELVKVQDGVETVLATEAAGYRFNDALDLGIVAAGGRIDILLDGKSVFGPVTDASPLPGGTIGVVSSGQKSSIFDDVTVNKVALTAHGEAPARTLADGDTAEVSVTAASSFGPDEITGYRWLVDGQEVGTGREAVLTLDAGTASVTLEVTDASGKVSTDIVAVDVVGQDRVMLDEGFATELSDAWRIVDEGNYEGPSDWVVEEGRLYQNSNIYSDQLIAGGPSNANDWNKGWSPLGDGTYVLRKGTTALYEPADVDTAAWKDYSVEASFNTPDNDGLGFVFYYQDPDNHYKLELDNQQGIWTLVRLLDGVEEVLGQAWNGYAMNRETLLRVDIKDNQITAYLDGEAIFPNAIEDRAHQGGTFGLYSWGSQGVSFDDVKVVSLSDAGQTPPDSGIEDLVLVGTEGADTLNGDAGDDELLGEAGDDLLNGKAGDDVLSGATGDDVLRGGAGDDELSGGDGDDVLHGGAGDDVLDGGDGVDTADFSDDATGVVIDLTEGIAIGAASGEDELSGIENATGGSGDDVLAGDAGSNLLTGGAGHDTVRIEAEGEVLVDLSTGTVDGAALGSDRLVDIEALLFGDGDDTIRFTTGDALLDVDGGAGTNTLRLEGAGSGRLGALDNIQRIELASGAWTLSDEGADIAMGPGAQRLLLEAELFADGALQGVVSGFGVDDRIVLKDLEGLGNAVLKPGNILSIDHAGGTLTIALDPEQDLSRADFLLNQTEAGTELSFEIAEDEQLTGGAKGDVIEGHGGDDVISGKSGADRLDGGRGDDVVDGGSGNDVVDGGEGDDRLDAGSGEDLVEGGAGDDSIDAGSGNDTIFAGSGADTVKAGSGDDRIDGGLGADLLSGGSGMDTFVFHAEHGNDRIEDFRSGDMLAFSSDVFADFDAFASGVRQVGKDLVIASQHGEITLTATDLADLTEQDVWFI